MYLLDLVPRERLFISEISSRTFTERAYHRRSNRSAIQPADARELDGTGMVPSYAPVKQERDAPVGCSRLILIQASPCSY